MVTVEVYQTEQMETPFKLSLDTPFLKKALVLIFQKFHENFAGINFRERPKNYDFAGINFRERPKIRENAKVSTRETFYL